MELHRTLSPHLLDRIFAELGLVYGNTFLSRWSTLPSKIGGRSVMACVRDDWGQKLAYLEDWPAAIDWALKNLDPDFPPTVLKFRQLANSCPTPRPTPTTIEQGIDQKECEQARTVLAQAVEQLMSAQTQWLRGGTAWAHNLLQRIADGQYVCAYAHSKALEALGQHNANKIISKEQEAQSVEADAPNQTESFAYDGLNDAEALALSASCAQSEIGENTLLASLLLSPQFWPLAIARLSEATFYWPASKVLFSAITQLFTSGSTPPPMPLLLTEIDAIANSLPSSTAWPGQQWLQNIVNESPQLSQTEFEALVDAQIQMHLVRHLQQTCIDFARRAQNTSSSNASALIEQAKSAIINVSTMSSRSDDEQIIGDATIGAIESAHQSMFAQGGITGLPSGIPSLDQLTSGLQRGDLFVLAARPAMGKSALALQIALHNAMEGIPVAFYTLEMHPRQLACRAISILSGVSLTHILRGQLSLNDARAVRRAALQLANLPLIFVQSAASVQQLAANAASLRARYGAIGLIVVDYLQLLEDSTSPNAPRVNQVATISRTLKKSARSLSCPIIALSQLSRAVEGRENHRPLLADLRDSGAIEQDADTIAFIYRDDYYFADSPDKGLAEIIIAKARSGPTGSIKCSFEQEATAFFERPAEPTF